MWSLESCVRVCVFCTKGAGTCACGNMPNCGVCLYVAVVDEIRSSGLRGRVTRSRIFQPVLSPMPLLVCLCACIADLFFASMSLRICAAKALARCMVAVHSLSGLDACLCSLALH